MNPAGPFTRLRLLPPAAWLLLIAGCQVATDQPQSGATQTESKTVARSVVERGPVRLTVEVEPRQPRLSDEPVLTLTIDSETGVKVQKPPFGESLGDLLIRDFREPLPEVKHNREIRKQIYTLEPTRAGKISLSPISVNFTDGRREGDGKEHTISSEPLEIEVTTVVGSDAPSLAQLKPAAGPVEIEGLMGSVLWWVAGGTVTLAFLGFVLWKRMRRGMTPTEPLLAPSELAYLELERLLEGRLAELDVKLFYVELTAIVRRYIERTTGIHAPEQTTEEFLREISRDQKFSAAERDRLQHFLVSADMVKFAGHQPQKTDIEDSFQRAKLFIGLGRGEVAA